MLVYSRLGLLFYLFRGQFLPQQIRTILVHAEVREVPKWL